MTAGVKADKKEFEERVTVVLSLFARGWKSPKIVQNVSQTWGVTSRQAYNYVRAARRRIEAHTKHQREHLLGDMLYRHDDMRDRAYQDHDLRLLLAIDQEDSKLLGLYAPTKQEVSGGLVITIGGIDPNEDI